MEERIQRWKEELDSMQEKNIPADVDAEKNKGQLLKDEWFAQHQKKFGWNNHQQNFHPSDRLGNIYNL